MTDPIRPTDNEARAMARDLLGGARFGALGVIDPDSGTPMVSRVAVAHLRSAPHLLVSDLSTHTTALTANPACSLLVGEPGPKGDPLTYPRLTLQARAEPVDKAPLREGWLRLHPKAKVYIDFADFRFFRLEITAGFLNGGFGKAYRLIRSDLTA